MQYLIKIISTVINLCFNLILGIVLPRFLGPIQFGKYELINNTLNNIFSFFDFGSSSYYYTNLSKNPSNKNLVKKYLMYVFLIAVLVIIVSIILTTNNFQIKQLLNIDFSILYFSIIFAFFNWLLNIYRYSYDALNLTIIGEKTWLIYRFLALIGLAYLYLNNYSGIEYLYIKDIVIMLMILTFYTIIISKQLQKNYRSNSEIKSTSTFFNYIKPLFLLSFINLIASSVDRFILERFSLPEEQGFFSIAFRISQIGIVFSGSIIQLMHRSLSIADDEIQNRVIIERDASIMFVITTVISFIIYFNSGFILYIFGGNEYYKALPALTIISLYPIHQIYGQIASTFFLSKSLTKQYTIINFFSLLLGLVLLWFFLAPNHLFGMQMNSFGLSLKLVISNIVSSNVLMFVVLKKLNLKFSNFIFFQIKIIIISYIVGKLISIVLGYLLKNAILFFLLNSSIFLIIILIIFIKYHSYFNLKHPIINRLNLYLIKIF